MTSLFTSVVHQEAKDNVMKVLDSGWLGLGPQTERFEKEFGDYVGAKYAIGFNSATAALHVAVRLSNISRGFKVLTTPNTFVSTNHVLMQEGLIPVFYDIDYFSGSINVASARELLTRTVDVKGIMAVHYGGEPFDIDEVYQLADEHGLVVIEDAAHAAGASYKGRKIGSKAKFCCFSFHAVKNLAIGDGGMLTTNSKEVMEEAKKLRWLGISKSTADRAQHGKYSWDYTVDSIGYKNHMNDIQAALGLGQLIHLDSDNKHRRALCNKYRELIGVALGSAFRIQCTRPKPDRESSNHLMVVLAESQPMRDFVMDYLKKNDIQTGVHYRPNYHYSVYKPFASKGDCTQMEMFWRRAISLPLHLKMGPSDVEKIVAAMEAAVYSFDEETRRRK